MSTLVPFNSSPYPVIDAKTWSGIIQRWNRLKRHQRTEAAQTCRRIGHNSCTCPVGPFCRRCCQYFRAEGE